MVTTSTYHVLDPSGVLEKLYFQIGNELTSKEGNFKRIKYPCFERIMDNHISQCGELPAIDEFISCMRWYTIGDPIFSMELGGIRAWSTNHHTQVVGLIVKFTEEYYTRRKVK